MKEFITIIILFLASGIAETQTEKSKRNIENLLKVSDELNNGCQRRPNIASLCADVGQALPDYDKESDYVYSYEREIYEASCVNVLKDSDIEIKNKIRLMWTKYGKECHCTSPQFNVPKGSIIKLAVRKTFTDFIKDVVSWGIDLNFINKSDDRTVLDYVRDELNANKGNPTEPTLKAYYTLLKNAGAKHKSEL